MLVTKELWVIIDIIEYFFPTYYWSQWCPTIVWLQTFLWTSSFAFNRRKKPIHV